MMIAVIFGVFISFLRDRDPLHPPREFLPAPLHEWGRKMGNSDLPLPLSLDLRKTCAS